MYSLDWFRGKKITVMGLGIHGGGVGIAKWLRRHGAFVTATDLRDEHALASSIAELERTHAKDVAAARKDGAPAPHPVQYVLGSHPEELFTKVDMVIRNPAVRRDSPLLALARKHKVPVESDISIFFLLCPFPITAVSGTRGKTTTTLLIAAMAKAHDRRTVIGGNLRVSPLDSLDKLLALAVRNQRSGSPSSPPPVILELSSWMLEGLEPHSISPHVGVLTMIAADHLDRYDGIEDYARTKELTVAFQKEGDVAVLNADNARTSNIGHSRWLVRDAPHGGRTIWFSIKSSKPGSIPPKSDACFVRGGRILLRQSGKTVDVLPCSSIRLQGEHNLSNVLAAIAASQATGIPLGPIRKAIRAFKSVPYRLEEIRQFRGILYVNDSAATSPDGSIAALETYASKGKAKRIILLSGGADKKLEFGEWAKVVSRVAKQVVLFDGSATPRIVEALSSASANVSLADARSMREALTEVRRHAKRGDVVLLSPGCASFGVFQNEFDRGDQFARAVNRMR